MAPKLGGRAVSKTPSRTRLPRLDAPFGELETTPTSHCHESPKPGSRFAAPAAPMDMGDGLDDLVHDFTGLVQAFETPPAARRECPFSWSETESAAKRSSPVRAGETPASVWQFGDVESLPPLSSAKSGRDKLPDTAPLPLIPMPDEGAQQVTAVRKIDFSETASTVHRSSPLGTSDAVGLAFDHFDKRAGY